MLVVGLGNPGRKYQGTRHNVGFDVVERLSERWGFRADQKEQLGAQVGDGLVKQQRCMVVRPQSFMNRSGKPTSDLARYFKVDSDQVVVIHDDLDLPFGAVRCKVGGGHGGHNGLRDIHKHLGSDYLRVRVGISRPPQGWDTADYVLGKWSSEEKGRLPDAIDTACDAIEAVLDAGISVAMNQFNARSDEGASTSRKSNPTIQDEPA
jgi:PTH1 family peptidyl-tRNA hydrolase